MTTKTVILIDGPNDDLWCELRPLEGEGDGEDQAIILRGNLGTCGDRVDKPAEISWSEAGRLATEDMTVLSPHDLRFCMDPAQVEEGTLLEDVLDTKGSWNTAVALAMDDVKLAKVLDDLLADPAAAGPGNSGEAA